MPNYAARIERAREAMARKGIDSLYLAPSANAQNLRGGRRNRPHFGNVSFPGGWVQALLLGLNHGPCWRCHGWSLISTRARRRPEVCELPDRADPTTFVHNCCASFEPRIGAIALENHAWAEQPLTLRQVRPDVDQRLASEVLAP